MAATELDPLDWLIQTTTSTPVVHTTTTATTPTEVAAAPAVAAPVVATPAPPAVPTAAAPVQVVKQGNSWLLPALVLGICLIVAALLFRSGGPAPSPDDGDNPPAPKPVSREVVEAFDKAVTEFIGGFGEDIEAIGKRVGPDDIDTIDKWTNAQKDAYIAREDAFIKATGELDNKYVPQPIEKDDAKSLKAGNDVFTARDLNAAELKQLSDYTIASGKGLQQAVSK